MTAKTAAKTSGQAGESRKEYEAAEKFTLDREPKPAAVRIDADKCRQKAMFSGMDCLAGQEDLFATD